MDEPKWHNEVIAYDYAKNHSLYGRFFQGDPRKFYTRMIDFVASTVPPATYIVSSAGRTALQYGSDYVYMSMGRPTWFIDREMAELLQTYESDSDDLSDIFVPYDCFSLIFERGIEINGYPLCSIRIATLKSQASRKILSEVGTFTPHDDMIRFYFNFGEDGLTGKCSPDTPPGRVVLWNWFRSFAGDKGYEDNTLSPIELATCRAAVRIACGALLYYSARPERVVNFTLPRSQRYTYKGERSSFKRVLLPSLHRNITTPSSGIPTGRTVSGHWRGWVFRILRHERYKRKPDGSFQTLLIPPTPVKGGPSQSG